MALGGALQKDVHLNQLLEIWVSCPALLKMRGKLSYTHTEWMSVCLSVFRSKSSFPLTLSRCHGEQAMNHVTYHSLLLLTSSFCLSALFIPSFPAVDGSWWTSLDLMRFVHVCSSVSFDEMCVVLLCVKMSEML